jgi:hypothetical protein
MSYVNNNFLVCALIVLERLVVMAAELVVPVPHVVCVCVCV